MAGRAVYGIEDGIALWRLPALVEFQIVGQDILDPFFDVFSHFMWLNWFKNRTKLRNILQKRAIII